MRNFILSLVVVTIATVSMPIMAASLQQLQREASQLYQTGDYKRAYSTYQKLAKDGDRFAQYRVSYMNLMALGGREDLLEAVAWAVLAAQSRQEELVDYMQTVASMVPEDQREKADKKISFYLRKWGKHADDSGYRESESECTGTRLCNHSKKTRRSPAPSNLWTANRDDADRGIETPQELKARALNLNKSIQEIHAPVTNINGEES